MMRWLCRTLALGVIVTSIGVAPQVADAQSGARTRARREAIVPGVELALSPIAGERYRYTMEVRPTSWRPAEVVADRRLLWLEFRDAGSRGRRGRRVTCRHPDAPRRVEDARVREVGSSETPSYREWIDLREYCVGRSLEALERGATVSVQYGFARARARRGVFVARPKGDEANEVRALAPVELAFAARPETTAEPAPTPAPAPAVSISLRDADVSSEAALSFRPTLRSTGASMRIYPRDDLFRFLVRGPLGETECGLDRVPIVPIIDFFARLGGRRARTTSILARLACPGAFQVDGAYEVVPVVDLVYDGSRDELSDVVTGTFEGEPALVRIRRGDHGYVERDATPSNSDGP